jgi:hypothetical protein
VMRRHHVAGEKACRTGLAPTCPCFAFSAAREAAGSQQSEERGQRGLLRRSRDQPDLRGHAGAPLGRNPASAAASRGRGRIRPDLHSQVPRADLLSLAACNAAIALGMRSTKRSSHTQPRPEPEMKAVTTGVCIRGSSRSILSNSSRRRPLAERHIIPSRLQELRRLRGLRHIVG